MWGQCTAWRTSECVLVGRKSSWRRGWVACEACAMGEHSRDRRRAQCRESLSVSRLPPFPPRRPAVDRNNSTLASLPQPSRSHSLSRCLWSRYALGRKGSMQHVVRVLRVYFSASASFGALPSFADSRSSSAPLHSSAK